MFTLKMLIWYVLFYFDVKFQFSIHFNHELILEPPKSKRNRRTNAVRYAQANKFGSSTALDQQSNNGFIRGVQMGARVPPFVSSIEAYVNAMQTTRIYSFYFKLFDQGHIQH